MITNPPELGLIESHHYEARQFIDELKQMVSDLVLAVLADNGTKNETSA